MLRTKLFIIGFTLILEAPSAFAKILTPQEAAAVFEGLVVCDGSKRAEEICKKNCTGDHPLLLIEGTCKDQTTWNYCLTHCRKDWIEECAKTATKHNLTGLAQCQ